MEKMTEELREDYLQALEGRRMWLEWKKKYALDNHCGLILFPSLCKELNEAGSRQLPSFMKRKYLKKALALYTQEMPVPLVTGEGFEIITVGIAKEKMEALLKYYCLIQFTKNIVVISTEEPFGNNGIIGKEGISLEDYVRNGIYV